MRLIPSVAALLAIAATAAAQPRKPPPPLAPGTSSIGGTLRDAVTKAPVAGCTVRAGANKRFSSVTTGEDGTYEFADIAEGRYYLTVECPAHLRGCVNVGDPAAMICTEITLFRDQRRSDLDIALLPAAIARGRVIDSSGKPVPDAAVRLGRPRSDRPYMAVTTVTKSDGAFELRSLPDGEWPIEVEIPAVPGSPRPPVIFYPGVIAREGAGFVRFVPGAITEDVTITVPRSLSSTVTVRMPPPDATMRSIVVSMIRASPLLTIPLALDSEGRATVTALSEGRYFVSATALSGGDKWAAFEIIDFFQDSLDVSLHLQPAGRIRGRIVAERGGMPPLSGASVGAAWIDDDVTLNPLSPDESGVAPDGTFEIDGLFGRRLLQLVRFDPDWKIESVLYGRSDVTATGIDVIPNATLDVTIVVARR